MRERVIYMFLILAAISIAGCGNSKESTDEAAGYVAAAEERFGKDFLCEPNATEEYILCAHHPDTTAMSPVPRVAFIVFDVAADEVVVEQAQVTGRVLWTSDYEIEMTLTPGIVTVDGQGAPKYRIDVRSGDRNRLDGLDEIPK